MEKVYLLYGENRELIESKKEEIIKNSEIDEFNISIFDLEESSLAEALSEAMSIPFMSEKRIVVFKNIPYFSTEKSKSEEDIESLKNYLDNYPDFTISLFLSPYPQIDSKKTIVKLAKELGEVIECSAYSKEDITRWIDLTIKNSKHTYTIDARNELLSRLDQDPYNFKNEMNKLLLYHWKTLWHKVK